MDGAKVDDGGAVDDPGDDRAGPRPQPDRVVAGHGHPHRLDLDAGQGAPSGRSRGAHRLQALVGAEALPELSGSERRHAPEVDGLAVLAQVGQRGVLQCGQHQRPGPQSPGQPVAAAGLDQAGPPGDDAGLGPAQELVAGERHQRRTGLERLAGGRLGVQPRRRAAVQPRASAVEQPRADVDHQRRSQVGQLGRAGRLGVAHHPEVRLVHLHHDGHIVAGVGHRGGEVVPAGAVGGPHLHQPGARPRHHVGHPEPAPDLHQLASGDHRVAALGQRGQHQHHRRGAIVHRHRGLGPAGPGQQRGRAGLAVAALAGLEIQLQVGIVGALAPGQRRPPQVGVQQHAGPVDDRRQQPPADGAGPVLGRIGITGRDRGPGRVHQKRMGQVEAGQRAG